MVIVIDAGEPCAQIRSVHAIEEADCMCGGEIRFPRRLKRPQLVIERAWIETSSAENRQSAL
jgi:hypothetical protein